MATPAFITKKQNKGYQLIASSMNRYVLHGDGCWWLIDMNKKTQAPYKTVSDVRRAFDSLPGYQFSQFRRVKTPSWLIRETGGDVASYQSPDSPPETVLRLSVPCGGCSWALLSDNGELLFCRDKGEALKTLKSFDWRHNQQLSA